MLLCLRRSESPTASPDLLDAVIRMLRLLDHPDDRNVLAPLIEREIVWRVINGPLGEPIRQIGTADSSLTHIAQAVRWITDHYAESFRVDDLARTCGMSASTFHRTFQGRYRAQPDPVPKADSPAAVRG